MNIRKASLIIFAVTFVAYFNTLNGFFISDDFGFLNFLVKQDIKVMFLDNLPFKGGYFIRPMGNLLWWFDYLLWGLNPVGYHITNSIIHGLNSLLVCLLAFYILKDETASIFAGILFALHPIHAEVVTWITARYDLACTLFYLLALFTFCLYAYKRHKLYIYLIAIISYPLALLSKEMAISLPFVLVLYDFVADRKIKFRLYLPFIITTLIYLAWRIILLGDIGGYRDSSGRPLFFQEFNLLGVVKGVVYHLPVNLLFPLSQAVFSPLHYKIFVLLLSAGVLSAVLLRSGRFKMTVVILSAGWIMLSIIPVYNMLGVGDNLSGSRVLYLPSVGFCIFLAYLIGRNIALKVIFCSLYVFILLVNNSPWNTAALISGAVPRIVKDFSKYKGLNNPIFYFYLPDTIKGIWGPLCGGMEEIIYPLFTPFKKENVRIFNDTNPGCNWGYNYDNDIDLRALRFKEEIGKNIFFFSYNEKNNKIEEKSVEIKSRLKANIPKISDLNWDFSSDKVRKEWRPYNLSYNSRDKFISLNDTPYMFSPLLRIPPASLGLIEIKMRAKSADNAVTPCEICWISNKDDEYNHRKRIAFPVKLDDQFHVYRVPFRLFNPDWLAEDFYITEIQFRPTSCIAQLEIGYIRLIPYEESQMNYTFQDETVK